MKKVIVLSIILCIAYTTFGQFVCGHEPPTPSRLSGNEYIANGGIFTPKGDIRVLFIFVKYGGIYDTMSVNGWNNGQFPDWATSSTTKTFYNDYSEFPNMFFSDSTRKSVSNFYYQMSNGQFRIIADYYPSVITVDPSLVNSFQELHQQVIDQIPFTFDFSPYDNRRNKPNYNNDNSNSSADNIADFVIFCHRYSRDWHSFPATWIANVGFDGKSETFLNRKYRTPSLNEMYIREGFTYLSGGMEPISLFPHELGHALYDAPHYAGNNDVCGQYFYIPSAGWGCMRTENVYCCAAGWERYILDWTPSITANGVNSDIKSTSDLSTNNGVFILRDFITTGDAIRISVPSRTNLKQHLWLENHQGMSTFDGTINYSTYCNTQIDGFHNGIVAYVEAYSHVKDSFFCLIDKANGVRWFSNDGNYDFTYEQCPINPDEICNHTTYPLHKELPNSIGGQSVNEYIRHDFDNNGSIGYNYDNNNSQGGNEQSNAIKIDSDGPTAKYITGTGLTFQKGDKVGIDRNPCVKNIPKYFIGNNVLNEYYFNGISFEILDKLPDSSMVVKIRLDDVEIDRPVRWAATSIYLTNITSDSRPDVDVLSSITVDIDKSGTPNRHRNPANPNQTSSTIDDFITPTTFSCRDGSYFKQEAHSTVNVKNSSTLVLETGSLYEVGDGAVLNIKPTAVLHIKSGATLKVTGTGHVEIQDGAYICIEDGAHIQLVDQLSSLNLHTGYIAGTPFQQSNCTSTPLTSFVLASGSNGSIHTFSSNRYIQKKTYTGNVYEAWNEIYAGYNVTSFLRPGDVVFENGAHVILDAEGTVRLEPGVIVKQGAVLEVR